jgi:hypothetical protein
LEKTKIEKNISVKEFDEYRIFLIMGSLLLLLELTLSNTLLGTPNIRKDDDGITIERPEFLLLLLILFWAFSLIGGKTPVKKGIPICQ